MRWFAGAFLSRIVGRSMPRRLFSLLYVLVLVAFSCGAACNDKPTKPHEYQPYPQQLSDLSADSTYVYFRDEGTAFGRPIGIYRVPIEGGTEPEEVATGQLLYDPTVSRDGNELAFTVYPSGLVIRNLVSGQDSVFPLGWTAYLDWYNHDTLVCDLVGEGIFFLDRLSGGTKRLVPGVPSYPAVTETGWLVFFRYKPEYGVPDTSLLIASDLHAADSETVVCLLGDEARYPRWSRDGRQVVFVRSYHVTPRVCTLEFPEARLTDSVAVNATNPCFAPDGRIVFVALGDKSRGEKDNICVMNMDGTDKRFLLDDSQ